MTIDQEEARVTVGAGIRYGDLCEALHRAGYALPNMASLPHISIAGACATATHGSGDRNAVLASSVSSIEMVIADGSLVSLSRERDGDTFRGAVVSLGALGIVTSLTLDLVPSFDMRQEVYEGLPLSTVGEAFEEIASSDYSISFFTDWRGDTIPQVWRKRAVSDSATGEGEAEWFGARRATVALHPIAGVDPVHCTVQLGVPGPWYERLPHFQLAFTPSSGDELQSEYLVPRQHARAAIAAVAGLAEEIAPLLQISEIRTIASDDLWMSPCYQQPCIGLHFTWKPEWPAVRRLLPLIEARLAPLAARPHWGKLFTMPPASLPPLYPRMRGLCGAGTSLRSGRQVP